MIIAETNRLVIRHFRLTDHRAMNQVFGDPEVMRFGEGVQSSEWVFNWVEHCIESYNQSSSHVPWAVVEKSSAETIGYCGLFFYSDVCGQPETELGYRLAKEYWSKGYATEAVLAVQAYVFNTKGLARLISIIDPQNIASIRVAEKTGMRYEKDVMLKGYTHPDRVYFINRADSASSESDELSPIQ